MPKLLIINITRNQGSTGKISEQIGLMMEQRGWEVCVAHGARYVKPSQIPSYQIQSKKDEYIHALKSLLLDADGCGSVKPSKRLVEFIKSSKPDIIHIHNFHGYYINYKILFEYLNSINIPIILTLHDCWAFTGHCTHFVTADCDKWKRECGNCPQIHSVPKSLFIDRSKKNLELKKNYIAANKNLHIVCVSNWTRGFLSDSIYKSHPSYKIHNGIDLNIFRPTKEKKKDVFQILAVGDHWNKAKGIFDIYKLREILPVDEYSITIVGLDKAQIKELPSGIKGILRTDSQKELAELYSESNVFINPTYADTFPTTNLESLACGTPIITYKTGGSPEALSPETGVVVEQGNVKALAEAIVKMKEHPLSSINCRLRAETCFDKDKCFLDYAELYEELLR